MFKGLHAHQIRKVCCLISLLLAPVLCQAQKAKVFAEELFHFHGRSEGDLHKQYIRLGEYLQFVDGIEPNDTKRDRLKNAALENYTARSDEFKKACTDLIAHLENWRNDEGIELQEVIAYEGEDGSQWVAWVLQGALSQQTERFYFQLIPVPNGWRLADGFYIGGRPN